MLLTVGRRKRAETIDRLYGAIVAQSRLPYFYTDLKVPDTVEGRFDLLVLHVYLLYRRMSGEDETARSIGQSVFDRFVEDMDANLRELGVGDLSVPKRMRAMGEAFYGRATVYNEALADGRDEMLTRALQRNLYSEAPDSEQAARRVAVYMRAAATALATQSAAMIAGGTIEFPRPEGAT